MTTLKSQFFDAVKQIEETVGGEEKFYCVKYCDDDLYGVPMKNIIYKARNPYGVWLQTYDYIHSKNPQLANQFFYSEDMFGELCDESKKIYSIIADKKIRSAVESTFESFLYGHTVWCIELTLWNK